MTSTLDIETLKVAINAMLGKPSGILTEKDIRWMAEALSAAFSNYTVEELASIVARTAAEKGDRPIQWLRWDS
ncbi:hypothetical protein [Aestuariivirga sp.]|uniref:hypothetical protein n=1 Tax=Aestuariivirga sp. TaxID=2650926 RepID=UPI003BA99FF7|eukprot:gene1988-2590_t